ncbi:MAG: hypothetical protein HY286_07455 [Planctomycetes bacterium]|nr:hypothetical protein [Planctomycetota bacterium]
MSSVVAFVFCCLSVAGAAGADGVKEALGALASPSAETRSKAAAKLRAELAPKDLPTVAETLKSATPRQRGALLDLIVDRRDLALEFIKIIDKNDKAILDLTSTAWARMNKFGLEPLRDARETVSMIVEGFGDCQFIENRATILTIDDLIYEIRRARLFAYDVVVDPSCAARTISFTKSVMTAESVALEALLVNNIPIFACGSDRAGDRTLPVFVSVGGRAGERPEDLVAGWLRLACSEGGLEGARAAAALLTLKTDPIDAAVVAQLGDPGCAAAPAVFAGICNVPARGAALLAADPGALDGFIKKAADAGISQKAVRVLAALPDADSSGRGVNAMLLKIAASGDESVKLGMLKSLVLRRAKEASSFFAESVKNTNPMACEIALRGLHRIDGAAANAFALQVLQTRAEREALEAAARIIITREGACDAAAELLEQSSGWRRACVAGVLFYSKKPELVAGALAAARSIRDPQALRMVAGFARDAVFEGNVKLIKSELAKRNLADELPLAIVAAFVNATDRSKDELLASAILAGAPRDLADLAGEAAGMLASSEFVKNQIVDALAPMVKEPAPPTPINPIATKPIPTKPSAIDSRPATQPATRPATVSASKTEPGDTNDPNPTPRKPPTPERLRMLGNMLGGHLLSLERSERSGFLDYLSDGAPKRGVALADAATLLSLTGVGAFVKSDPGRPQVEIALDRAKSFPAPDEY